MKNINYYLTFVFLLCFYGLSASSIKGKVLSDTGEPVFYANVILFNSTDSLIIDLQYSEEDGSFIFSDLNEGNYWLECRYVGYPDIVLGEVSLSEDKELVLDDLVFDPPINELEEVVVKARKPMLELKPNKVVMNVEGSINSSGEDAFSLLRKAPGVLIDNNDNILMLGKAGVQIYIDGKPSPLNGTDLAEYLKSIPSSEIESIEIITQPSAKYDAQGNSGIINIKFRRDKNLGTSGNASISGRKGETEGLSGNLRLTNKTKKFNTFGSVSAYGGDNINPFALYREQSGLVFDQSAMGSGDYQGVNYRLGTDVYLHPQHTLGVLFTGSDNSGSQFQNSETFISMIGSDMIDSILVAQANREYERDNKTYNFNYKFDNGKGKSLNFDLDHGMYKSDSDEFQPNTYIGYGTNDTLSVRDFANETPSEIMISTLKMDYEQPAFNGVLVLDSNYRG